jgi:hypothetical protein
MPSSGNSPRDIHISRDTRQGSRETSLAFFIFQMHGSLMLSVSISLILGISYSLTLAPGLTWANGGTDGGDLITAAATRGVAHPGGYPLYLWLAQLFQQIPLGNLAWRTNVMSALCMVLAAILLFLTAHHLLDGRPYARLAAWGAALTFGLSPLVWSQAVITEVYALQTLLTAIILFQTLGWKRSWNGDLLRGLTIGLAMGCHMTAAFLLPLLLWDVDAPCQNLKKHIGWRLGGVLAGALIYLWLPVWAMGDPPVNWGNPVTPQAFFQLVTGSIYQSNFTLAYLFERLRGLAGVLIEQAGLIGLFLAVFHLAGIREKFFHAFPLVWVFMVYALFALVYGTLDSYVYLLPSIIVYLLWIACGLQEIIEIAAARWHLSIIPILLILCFALARQMVVTVPRVDASHDMRAENFGQKVMQTLPEESLVFARDDESSFALWYFHFALKQRPDIIVVVDGLLKYDWYQHTLKTTYPDLCFPPEDELSAASLAAANPSQPYCTIGDHNLEKITCLNR